MKLFSMIFVPYTISCFLLVALLPFSVSYENYLGDDIFTFVYFNGRIKEVTIKEEVQEVVRNSAIVWSGKFPQEVWVLIVIGLGCILVASLYKLIFSDREDRRISSIITIIGGILGVTGTLLFLTFLYTELIPTIPTRIIYGFYISIGAFASLILIGLVLLVISFKQPYAVKEYDPIEEVMNK